MLILRGTIWTFLVRQGKLNNKNILGDTRGKSKEDYESGIIIRKE